MQKISLSVLIAAATLTTLVGCASKPSHEAPKEPVAADSAKIRLFGQNGIQVTLHKNVGCDGIGESVVVSGDMGKAFSSMFGAVENESIGMMETDNSKNVSKLGGLGSFAYYKEIALKPDEPVRIRMGFKEYSGKSCSPSYWSFVPEKNAEYEGLVKVDLDAKVCLYILNRITEKGELEPIKSKHSCS